MTTTYSSDFTTVRDRLRLLIFDRMPPYWDTTKTYRYAFSDEELAQLYSETSSDIWMTAAVCVETLALDAAKRAIAFDILQQDLRVDRTLTPSYLLKVAKQYRERAYAVPSTQRGTWTDGDDEWLKTAMNFDQYDMEDSFDS